MAGVGETMGCQREEGLGRVLPPLLSLVAERGALVDIDALGPSNSNQRQVHSALD